MNSTPQTIAIVGEGPAANILGSLLSEQGLKVAIFSEGQHISPDIGETLQPAIIPSLKALDLEDFLRPTSMRNSGVSVCLDENIAVDFLFEKFKSKYPQYAYHIPGHLLDAVLRQATKKYGVPSFICPVHITYDEKNDQLTLAEKTLAASDNFFSAPPDLIIVASDEVPLPENMELEKEDFSRKEHILTACHDGVVLKYKTNLHIDRYRHGWGWRIPLPGREELGIIASEELLISMGTTIEEQYDTFLAKDPFLAWATRYARRLSPVSMQPYHSYIHHRIKGSNWLLIGSSAAYIDPIFSNQAALSIKSAVMLAEALSKKSQGGLLKFQEEYLAELYMWQRILDLWYDGRLASLFRLGKNRSHVIIGKMINYHISKHMGRIFTGEMNQSSYSRNLLWFVTDYGLNGMVGRDPAKWAINK